MKFLESNFFFFFWWALLGPAGGERKTKTLISMVFGYSNWLAFSLYVYYKVHVQAVQWTPILSRIYKQYSYKYDGIAVFNEKLRAPGIETWTPLQITREVMFNKRRNTDAHNSWIPYKRSYCDLWLYQ